MPTFMESAYAEPPIEDTSKNPRMLRRWLTVTDTTS